MLCCPLSPHRRRLIRKTRKHVEVFAVANFGPKYIFPTSMAYSFREKTRSARQISLFVERVGLFGALAIKKKSLR
jgi:hypothetical protein